MITIFTIPKAFNGHIGIIQNNAIQSWLKLEPKCEVFLCGDEEGVAETAVYYGIHHLPNLEKNSYGTPLVRSAFESVERVAANPILCYVNADIIFLQSVIDSLELIKFSKFLMIGQRWNLDVLKPIVYSNPHWEEIMVSQVQEYGKLFKPDGCDFFIFPKEIKWDFPEFAVGRPGWDNWFIYKARSLQLPVIDATNTAIVIHQNHDYRHVPGRINDFTFNGPEADINRTYLKSGEGTFTIKDSTHVIINNLIINANSYEYLKKRIPHQSVLLSNMSSLTKLFWKLMNKLISYPKFFPEKIWGPILYEITK